MRTTTSGFTISELMIGVSLSMIVMGAVLSSYVFVARAYTKTIGFGDANQPTLESQSRRTLAIFAQDAQVTLGILATPTATYPVSDKEVTLIVPRATGGTKNVTYYYNDTTAAVSVTKNTDTGSDTVSVPATSLVRIDWSGSTATALTLHSSLKSFAFTYYDTFADVDVTGTARPYLTYVNYLIGIKQVSFKLTAQAGTGSNVTQLYKIASPRYAFRNKSLLY